jgi:choline dehydrogenase-like flavoprotein
MQHTFDVVVVGSGAGGAPIANVLVRAGKSVLVIEKGPLLRPCDQVPGRRSDFRRDEIYSSSPEKILGIPGLANSGVSYYSSHVEPDINDEPHIYRGEANQDYATIEGYTAQVVGGGTQLYGGVSLRFTPTDMQLRTFNSRRRTPLKDDPTGTVQKEARDWPVRPRERPTSEKPETFRVHQKPAPRFGLGLHLVFGPSGHESADCRAKSRCSVHGRARPGGVSNQQADPEDRLRQEVRPRELPQRSLGPHHGKLRCSYREDVIAPTDPCDPWPLRFSH